LELWVKHYALICYFFFKWAVWVDKKNYFFQKQKFEIDFLELFICGKLWIISFWSRSQKLQGVLVCGQLWIIYSKINLKVLYFTQFSIFFEKNKIIVCGLFITIFQPLGLAFFNSKTKFSTILYFESFSTSFYLTFFFLYVVQFQMIWNFSSM